MRITLSISNPAGPDEGDLLSLEVYPEMTVETLQSSIQAETAVQPEAQHLYHNGQRLTDKTKTMTELAITDGDLLALHIRDTRGAAQPGAQQTRSAAQQQRPEPELIRLRILGDPQLRAELQRAQPELAALVDDPAGFAQYFNAGAERERRETQERQQAIQRLNEDPFDVEAQAKIEEMIRQERVMENLQNAMEHNPEVFGRVHLLYSEVEVNGHKMKALVDTGAQATIMSPHCAEACGIMRLVDKRFAGVARGVGTANIIGRVHAAQIKIGNLFLPCSFTVMEGKNVELLLGLDMLKRYQATVDLTRDKLIIQGEEIPFLSEADIPKEAEEALEEEPKVPGPAGTTIGGRSGVVSPPHTQSAQAGSSGSSQQAPPAAAARPAAATPAPAPAQPPRQQAPQIQVQSQFPEEAIQQLVAIGASRERAIRALQQTGGNVEYAAAAIFEDF